MIEINRDINNSKTLCSDFYLNDKFFEESKNIFEESIQPICSRLEINNLNIYPVKYFPNFLDENLLITNKDGKFHCMSNVCTHRGHLLAECVKNDDFIQCRYHGRTFALDGNLKNAPGFQNTINFPSKNDNLFQVPIFNWNDFLFISLSNNDKVFELLNQIDRILPKFPYSNLSESPIRKDYLINCHWALYCDNYLEGFHIPYVHKGLNEDMDWKEYETDILNEIVLQKAISKRPENIIDYDNENNVYAYYFFIFPNIMINYYKWGISINIVEPISKEKTRIKYILYNLKNQKIPSNASSSVDVVEIEDQEVVLSVQKGIKSRYYDSGRFSPEMEKGVHYFHRLISEKLLKFNEDL